MAAAAHVQGQTTDTEKLYDFSYLPEPVWVKVFEHLTLIDKYHISITCRSLYDIFNHPSNWKSASLSSVGGNHNFSMTTSYVSNKFKVIVDKFGHFFQDLTISISGHLVQMHNDIKEILVHMSEVCRLEHLVLEVGLMTSDFHLYGIRPQEEGLCCILNLISTAFRLKKIEILSWPMFPEIFKNAELNVFEVMKKNPRLESLKSLSLFWVKKEKQWSERMPLLPSSSYTLSLISHFQSLQYLDIRSPMLSDSLIKELASSSRARLDTLRILMSFVAQDPKHSIPEISSSSWSALVQRSPRLAVEITVMSRVSDVDMGALLKPEVPLTEFKILKFARCSETLIYTLTEKFKNSFQSFICYADPTDCDDELLRLVNNCSQLHTLVFYGQIHYNKLMSIVKGRKSWKHLDFIESCILTESMGEEFDDDTVIGRDAGGDLVQVGLLRFHGEQTEDEREKLLSALKAEVSHRTGYTWRPSTTASL